MARYDDDTLALIRALPAYKLAVIADCSVDNDAAETFLTGIRDDVLERTEYVSADDWERELVEDYSGQAHEIADQAPSVYTVDMWRQFVGTRAYREDPIGELGIESDMNQLGAVSLYLIASRLVNALATDIAESITDDDDDSE